MVAADPQLGGGRGRVGTPSGDYSLHALWQRTAAADSSGCASSAAAFVDGSAPLMYSGRVLAEAIAEAHGGPSKALEEQ